MRRLPLLLLSCLVASPPGPAFAVDSVLVEETARWSSPTAWSTAPVFPDNTDTTSFDVFIGDRFGDGFVTVDLDVTVDSVRFVGGRLDGPGVLSIEEVFSLSGTSRVEATLDVSGGIRAPRSSSDLGTPEIVGAVRSLGQFIELDFGVLRLEAGDLSVPDLTLSGQSALEVTGDLSVTRSLRWQGGTLTGSGTTETTGTLELFSGELDGRTLLQRGAATLLGSSFDLRNGAEVLNAEGATFEAGASTTSRVSGDGRFENRGVFRAGSAIFSTPFDNHGTVEVRERSLQLWGPGEHSGRFEVAEGGSLLFRRENEFQAGSVIEGPGEVVLDGTEVSGRYDVSGRTVTRGARFLGAPVSLGELEVARNPAATRFDADSIRPSALTMLGGDLEIDGTVSVDGLTRWVSGFMRGAGTTFAGGGLEMEGSPRLVGRSLVNEREARLIGSTSDLTLEDGATFRNTRGAIFRVDSAEQVAIESEGDANRFVNDGLLRVTGAGGGTFNIWSTYEGSGQVEVESGRLLLRDGGALTGSASVDAGASLFLGGDFSLPAGSEVSGAGSVGFGGDTTVRGRYAVGATSAGTSSLVRFESTGQSLGDLTVSRGVVRILTDARAGRVHQTSGGTLEVADSTLESDDYRGELGRLRLLDGRVVAPGGIVSTGARIEGSGVLEGDVEVSGGLVDTPFGRDPILVIGALAPGSLPGGRVGLLEITGDLALGEDSRLGIQLDGDEPGTGHDAVTVAGGAVLGGMLAVSVFDDFAEQIEDDDVFRVLAAGGALAGAFDNAASGERLETPEGHSFRVDYGPGSAFEPSDLVLSRFRLVPEPGTALLLGVGLAALARQRSRTR